MSLWWLWIGIGAGLAVFMYEAILKWRARREATAAVGAEQRSYLRRLARRPGAGELLELFSVDPDDPSLTAGEAAEAIEALRAAAGQGGIVTGRRRSASQSLDSAALEVDMRAGVSVRVAERRARPPGWLVAVLVALWVA